MARKTAPPLPFVGKSGDPNRNASVSGIPRAPARLAIPPAAYVAATIAVLVTLVFLIYAQVRTHSFINFDDPAYVSANEHVLGGLTWSGVTWAFTHIHAAYWIPLTWISHMLDVQLFGRNAGAHLLVSVALHAVNSVLVFLFLRLATGALWRSATVAALFAVHPLHVESVAWISERKDTLSTLFFLLCLLAYTDYVLKRSRVSYAASVSALAIGLLAKPMLVTTPLILLLLDYWPFRRGDVRRVVVEKIPFVLCIVPATIATAFAQRQAMSALDVVPLPVRLANAAIAYVRYMEKTFWPAKLAIVYPYPTTIALSFSIACALLLAIVTGTVIWFRRSAPWLLVGWCWFILTLVPVIGIVQVGVQAMADRFTYIPHIGLFIGIVWTCAELARRFEFATAAPVIACLIVVLLAITAHAQVGYWSGNVPLFEHAVAVTSNNKMAHFNLGAGYLERGDYQAAEREYRQAEGLQPADGVFLGLALSLMRQDKLDAAGAAAREAMKANPQNSRAASIIGTIELAQGRASVAEPFLARSAALQNDPLVLGRLALARGQLEEARAQFTKATEKAPNLADAHFALARVLDKLGDSSAAREYEEAIRLNPNLYDSRMNYGALLSRLGRDEDAAAEFLQAGRLRPQSVEPHVYAGLVAAKLRRFDDAEREIQGAIAADHDGSNRILIDAIRIPPRPNAIDEYLAFLRQQSGGH